MKALINGLLYDTEKADLICKLREGEYDEEEYYRTPRGNWFKHSPEAELSPGEITPLTAEEVFSQLSEYYDHENIRKVLEERFSDMIKEA